MIVHRIIPALRFCLFTTTYLSYYLSRYPYLPVFLSVHFLPLGHRHRPSRIMDISHSLYTDTHLRSPPLYAV